MNKVYIGMGTCGLATGAGKVREAVEKWAESRGQSIEITPTGCIGFCQVEPIMDVVVESGHRLSYGQVQPEDVSFILDEALNKNNYKIDGLLGQHRNGSTPLEGIPCLEEHPFFRKQLKKVLRNCGIINPVSLEEYKASGGFAGLGKALAMTPRDVIDEVTRSGLRGRGGGGFTTGKKWLFAYNENNAKKYIVCNADEGDPGAFMDRALMEGDPYAVLEGIMIAGYAIGADEGIVYCRAEYPLAIRRLEIAIEAMKKKGFSKVRSTERSSLSRYVSRWGPGPLSAARKQR